MVQFELWPNGLLASGTNVHELIEYVMDEKGVDMESCYDMQRELGEVGKWMKYYYGMNLTKWSKTVHQLNDTSNTNWWGYFDDVICFRHYF